MHRGIRGNYPGTSEFRFLMCVSWHGMAWCRNWHDMMAYVKPGSGDSKLRGGSWSGVQVTKSTSSFVDLCVGGCVIELQTANDSDFIKPTADI